MSGKYYTQVIYTRQHKDDPKIELLFVYDAETDNPTHIFRLTPYKERIMDYVPEEYLNCPRKLPPKWTWPKRFDSYVRLGESLNPPLCI